LDDILTNPGVTSAMIGHIKSIKMSGLSQRLWETISKLRVEEIKGAKPFRMLGAVTSSIALIPVMISPVVAFALYQIVAVRTGETLDATRLFAALSLILLLAQPLFWMFEMVLDLSAALGCFGRIEKYLCENSRVDYRHAPDGEAGTSLGQLHSGSTVDHIELRSLASRGIPPAVESSFGHINAIDVQGASFSWSTEGPLVLNGISLAVKPGQLAMLIGPVASGKSTLLKGLLGEVPHVIGTVNVAAGRLSWCDQSPWLIVSESPSRKSSHI
jgi:ATP-binding cassette, subfamily C (CFTR/MRP), member 1